MTISTLYCPTCGAVNSTNTVVCFACNHPLDEPLRETLLHNRYRLLEQVGSGGFGSVHRAEDTQEQHKIVAIKQINLAGLTPQQVIEATDGFNREVSLLSTLSHPHLPRIYEHFTDPDHWYLVMDFLEGETLEAYLEKTYTKRGELTPLPLSEVLDIGLQLCAVLDYLHTRKPAIIFRDVKPANIMRTPVGTLYLIDFGIARHYKPGKLKDTIPFGSPGYAAPEQYGKAQTSSRSDIYSLGALLHMLLSGNDPVDNPFHFDPLRLYWGEGAAELTTLIEQMVTLDKQQRPSAIQTVQQQLQSISEAQTHARMLSVAATPPPTPPTLLVQSAGNGLGQRMQQSMVQRRLIQQQRKQYWSYNRSKSRRKFVVGTASVVGLVALVGGGIGSLTSHFEHSYPAHVSLPPNLFKSPYSLARFSDSQAGPIAFVAWSPNGSRVALAANASLCVQTVDTTGLPDVFKNTIMKKYDVASSILALAWQPNIGETLAFSTDESLNLWSGNWTGASNSKQNIQDTQDQIQVQRETHASIDEKVIIQTFAWSPDGLHIAIPFARGVQIWNVNTKTHVQNLLFSSSTNATYELNQMTSLSWSPDGTYIAAAFSNYQPAIWRLADGRFFESVAEANSTLLTWSPNSQFLASTGSNVIQVTELSYMLNTDAKRHQTNKPNQFTYYTGHQGTVTALSWSPDGRYIASSSQDAQDNLHVWSPFNRKGNVPPANEAIALGNPQPGSDHTFSTTVIQSSNGINAVSWSPDGNYLLIGTDNVYVVPLNVTALN